MKFDLPDWPSVSPCLFINCEALDWINNSYLLPIVKEKKKHYPTWNQFLLRHFRQAEELWKCCTVTTGGAVTQSHLQLTAPLQAPGEVMAWAKWWRTIWGGGWGVVAAESSDGSRR